MFPIQSEKTKLLRKDDSPDRGMNICVNNILFLFLLFPMLCVYLLIKAHPCLASVVSTFTAMLQITAIMAISNDS